MAKPPSAPVAPGTTGTKKTRVKKERSAEAAALVADAKAAMKSAVALAKIIDPVSHLDKWGCEKLQEAVTSRLAALESATQS